MATINGASVYKTEGNPVNYSYDVIGKNSEVFAVGDPVTVTSGVMLVATATSTIWGIAQKVQTMTSTNQTVALVYPTYMPVQENMVFLMGTNADLTGNATDAGTFYKLTGTTGAVLVDVVSGVQTTTSKIVEIIKVDPNSVGGSGSGSGLRQVLVKFVKTPTLNVGGPA